MSNDNIIRDLPEYLEGPIGIDSETRDDDLKTLGPAWAFDIPDRYIAGVSICCDNLRGYIPFNHPGECKLNYSNEEARKWLSYQFTRRNDQPKIFSNAIYDLGWFWKEGIEISGIIHDILLQVPLLDEHRPQNSYNLDTVAYDYVGMRKDYTRLFEYAKKLGISEKAAVANLWRFPASEVADYATQDAVATVKVWEKTSELISQQDLNGIYHIESSLTKVLLDIRKRGVRVDLDRADQLKKHFATKKKECQDELHRQTGIFLDSPWTVGPIAKILDQFGIEYPLTPKTKKPSIKGEWLETLDHPSAKLIGSIRDYDRAGSMFIDDYIFGHEHKGRIHTQFNQLRSDEGGTVSGRLSSKNPNLQNIPARDAEIGLIIRQVFIPEEGEKWAALDYSAQEPRWTVHFACAANCKGGREASQKYKEDPHTDYHQMVADMCGIKRKEAKIINLGLAYGMGGVKLCHSLGLSTEVLIRDPNERWGEEYPLNSEKGQEYLLAGGNPYLGPGEEGRALLKKYHENAPFIRALNSKCKKRAKEVGYIRTILGRRCRFPLVDGERWYLHTAMNRLIQGSAADQTKKSLLLLHEGGYNPLISVHDENCFSVDSDKKVREIKEIMENCIPSEWVPFVAEAKIGDNWGECK